MKRTMLAALLTITSIHVTSTFIGGQDAKKPDRQVSAGINPYLLLIRDPAVHLELRMKNEQIAAIRQLTDELDGPLWVIRNKSLEEGTRKLQQLIAKAKDRMSEILTMSPRTRLEQIVLQYQGSRAVLRPDVTAQLKLINDQIKRIQQILKETDKAVGKLQKQAQSSKSRKPIDGRLARRRSDEKRTILATLSRNQRNQWSTMLGEPVDTSRFGKGLAFKAPEISGSKDWINSRPLKIENLRGRVVAVHFYAFG